MQDYQMLRDQCWPWRVAAYIAWASSPRVGRQPHTQMELAKQILGLTSDRVINTWRKKNPAIDEIVKPRDGAVTLPLPRASAALVTFS